MDSSRLLRKAVSIVSECLGYPEILSMRRYPDPVLRVPAAPVTEFGSALSAFVQRMFGTMNEQNGVGLAAPQVGVSAAILVTDHGRRKKDAPPEPRVWINPKIVRGTGEAIYEEGCLSVPEIYAKVQRFDTIEVTWNELDGRESRATYSYSAGDFLSIVLQHEMDHLVGKLFIDHLSMVQLILIRRRLKELEKDYKTKTGRSGAVLRR